MRAFVFERNGGPEVLETAGKLFVIP